MAFSSSVNDASDTRSPPSERRILAAGDQAFVVEFGQQIEQSVFAEVMALDRHIHQLSKAGTLDGLLETVPTFRSLAVFFDPLITTPDAMVHTIDSMPAAAADVASTDSRIWQLPVCYNATHGPDLDSVAEATRLTLDEVISEHQSTEYTAYMLGFLPGFAFLGDIPAALRLPRRSEPRTRVPAGSVAIANQLTAIYPWDSPGGWHLLGRCPIPLFDAGHAVPTVLRADDRIRFRSINNEELEAIEYAVQTDRFDIEELRLP